MRAGVLEQKAGGLDAYEQAFFCRKKMTAVIAKTAGTGFAPPSRFEQNRPRLLALFAERGYGHRLLAVNCGHCKITIVLCMLGTYNFSHLRRRGSPACRSFSTEA